MCWATFWVFFSQSHLVALTGAQEEKGREK
jgi:hypothetical protein